MQIQKPEKSVDFPAIERQIQIKWDVENTFQRSIDTRPASKSFNFYDGPPFATGLPHFGHFVPSSIKDAIPRYFTQKGYRVERRFGWDCHGVPIELLVQRELKLNGKPEIEKFGIAKFNQACRESVQRYTSEWREYMRRLGRWVDMENEYKTMDLDFMESVWSVVQKLWNAGLIYEGKHVMSFSATLGSTLSNAEASMDYRDIQDPSLTLKAKLTGKFKGTSLLVWTTTPWTMPANVAIAVDPKATYCHVQDKGELYLVIADRLDAYWPVDAGHEVIGTLLGSKLDGESYEPFFDCYREQHNSESFQVRCTDYVLHDTGTGAVHTAPAFGEDDFQCAKKYHLAMIDHLDANGCYLEGAPIQLTGLNFKEGDKLIIADLKKRGFVHKHETFVHSYPHCYRSGMPLMFRAMPSWFVNVEKLKARMIALNKDVRWVPEHLQQGRFGKWLENARDWNIGRSRYWGNPIPIWRNEETGESVCLGSVAELEKYAGRKVTDLHMEFIDDITIPSATGNGVLRRVPFVLDCWFESGSMPYAQAHFPFKDADTFADRFPADFICEGLDQTRCWFYNLMILSTALFDKPAFKNVVVNGIVLASDGRKMSKSLKNYDDPLETLDKLGADSIRLYILNSPATAAEELRYSSDGVKENTRRVLLPLWNAYSFFATYASIDKFDPENDMVPSHNEMDAWIQLRVRELNLHVDSSMQSYHISKVCPAIVEFLDDLNNWYIRRSRRRFWDGDKQAYSTLFEVLVLVTKLLAPYAPFSAEYFFQKLALTKELIANQSVHLTLIPDAVPLSQTERDQLAAVTIARRVVELGRTVRVTHKIKNRQPLQRLTVGILNPAIGDAVAAMKSVIADELNVKEVVVSLEPQTLATIVVKPNFKALGKTLGDKIKPLQAALKVLHNDIAMAAFRKETIHVAGVELKPSDVAVELTAAGSDLVATESDFVVALDSHISDTLRYEGLAREIVSHVQKARKSADFDVSDRIRLHITASEHMNEALRRSKEYIEEETLSSLHFEPLLSPIFVVDVNLDSEIVTLKLEISND